jgi:hypothetical protein
MITLMIARVPVSLALQLKLKYGRTLVGICRFMVWYICLIYVTLFGKTQFCVMEEERF